jgi:hypothetical protein
MPLRVEKLFQEYRTPASMAVASVLAGLALVTLVAKFVIERRLEAEARELEAARSLPDTIDGPDSQPDAKSRTPTQGSFA